MARQFDQSDQDYIDCGQWNEGSLQTAFAMFCWVYPDSWPDSDMRYFSKADGTSEQDHAMMMSNIDTNNLKVRVRIRIGTSTRTKIGTDHTGKTAGSWYHIGYQWANQKGGSLLDEDTIYVDGTAEAVATSAMSPSQTTWTDASTWPLYIGANKSGGGVDKEMDGRVAELCIWGKTGNNQTTYPLSDNEVTALYNGVPPYLIKPQLILGYWPLYGVQSPEPDLSGAGFNGTLQNTPTFGNHPPITVPPRPQIFIPEVAAETITLDKWYRPMSRPVIQRPSVISY